MRYRGGVFTEMDLDAVLARRPQVALIDELAHTNVPGCRNEKRWQDVDELLAAGIDVVTTLNIQHLESLNDVVAQITGTQQRETLPDEVARRADQIELVDMTAEALRRRMVHGNVYPPDRIEAALTHYFRPGNLTALRELALLWVADRTEEGLQRYRADHGITAPWETRERILVGITGVRGEEAVIRRAARIAARTPGSELLAVHVISGDAVAAGDRRLLTDHRELAISLGASYQEIADGDVARALLRFARAENVNQMVIGASAGRPLPAAGPGAARRGPAGQLLRAGTGVARRPGQDARCGRRGRGGSGRGRRRAGGGARRPADGAGGPGERGGDRVHPARGQRAARPRRPALAAGGDPPGVRAGRGQPAGAEAARGAARPALVRAGQRGRAPAGDAGGGRCGAVRPRADPGRAGASAQPR